jgi:hypothetical protein
MRLTQTYQAYQTLTAYGSLHTTCSTNRPQQLLGLGCKTASHQQRALWQTPKQKRVVKRQCIAAGQRSNDESKDNAVIAGVTVGLGAMLLLARMVVASLGEAQDLGSEIFLDSNYVGAGDVAGGLLWGVSLFYCSPLQVLLFFFGKVETERPSDLVLRQLGLLARLE